MRGAHDSGGTLLYEGERYDRLKAKIAFNGIERTLIVGPEPDSRFAPAFPIDVAAGEGGRPDPASLYAAMVELLDDLVPN